MAAFLFGKLLDHLDRGDWPRLNMRFRSAIILVLTLAAAALLLPGRRIASRLTGAMVTGAYASGQQAKPATPAPKSDGDYVGSDTCITCHDDQNRRIKDTPMGKVLLAHPRTPVEQRGCESCHGPGKAHVEAGGGKET